MRNWIAMAVFVAAQGVAAAANAEDDGGIKLDAACRLERLAAEAGPQPGRGLGFSIGGFSFGGGRRGRGESPPLTMDHGEILRNALRPEIADRLAADGPRFQEVFNFACLPVRGFVRSGWPLVVDYEAEGGAVAVVEIHLPGRDPIVLPLPVGSERQRQVRVLPPGLGDEPTPAVILLRVDRSQVETPSPMPTRIYSLGAGPRVADAPAIDELAFQPAELRLGNSDLASYSFHAGAGFKGVSADILRVDERDGVLQVRQVRSHPVAGGVAPDAWIGREPPLTWNGTSDGRQVSLGHHLLQVRLWSAPESGGDWAAYWSADTVRVKP